MNKRGVSAFLFVAILIVSLISVQALNTLQQECLTKATNLAFSQDRGVTDFELNECMTKGVSSGLKLPTSPQTKTPAVQAQIKYPVKESWQVTFSFSQEHMKELSDVTGVNESTLSATLRYIPLTSDAACTFSSSSNGKCIGSVNVMPQGSVPLNVLYEIKFSEYTPFSGNPLKLFSGDKFVNAQILNCQLGSKVVPARFNLADPFCRGRGRTDSLMEKVAESQSTQDVFGEAVTVETERSPSLSKPNFIVAETDKNSTRAAENAADQKARFYLAYTKKGELDRTGFKLDVPWKAKKITTFKDDSEIPKNLEGFYGYIGPVKTEEQQKTAEEATTPKKKGFWKKVGTGTWNIMTGTKEKAPTLAGDLQ